MTDWDHLQQLATEAAGCAYAPYSNYFVGAAALTTTGQIVTGCNVENASYGLTLCAECGLVSQLVARQAGVISAIVCVTSDGQVIMPCGRCRQLLIEHSSTEGHILTPAGVEPISALLPQAFVKANLDKGAHADD